MNFEIDKGIPFPDGSRGNKKYPWSQLSVGDSILGDMKVYYAARSWGIRHGVTFVSRSEGGKLRIWRKT